MQLHSYDYQIDEQGNWFCEGNPVGDPELFRILSRSLFESGGRYFIRCEGEVHPVRVADAPLVVRYVHIVVDGEEDHPSRVTIELQDGRKETLQASSLSVSPNDILYCRATPRRLRARFSKPAYYELTKYLLADEDSEQYFFIIGGERYNIAFKS